MVQVGMVSLVGAGPGDPELITLRGMRLLSQADVVVYDRLASDSLLSHVPREAEMIYVGKESSRHTLRQSDINALLVARAREGKKVVRLKGGDPFVFGRGGEEAEELVAAGIPFEVVPGISSAIAAPAYAGIPITHRGRATSFAVVTGHEDPSKPASGIQWDKLATGVDTLVFLMGLENLPQIVRKLIDHGRSLETPAALVRCGTRPSQETLTGTLGDIVEKARAHGLKSPVVTVIGEVVSLREKLRWFDNRPLFGKRILVTRAGEQASVLSRRLADAGAQPVELPVIRIEPPVSWETVDDAVAGLERYNWTVFTSANGVRAFFERLNVLGKDARAFGHCRLAAIGPATASALIERGVQADLVPESYVAEALAAKLLEQEVSGSRVLVPRAAEARNILRTLLEGEGAVVDEVTVYRTVSNPDAAGPLRELLERNSLDVVTFASSSSVRNLMEALGDDGVGLLSRMAVACIGPITAQTAVDHGLRVSVVAKEYTIPGLVRALESHFSPAGEEPDPEG